MPEPTTKPALIDITYSPALDQLFAALAAAQGDMSNPEKNKNNPHFKSRYADLASVREAVIPALAAQGLCVLQFLGSDGKRAHVETWIGHKSGQFMRSIYGAESRGSDPQSLSSAHTMLRRYALMAVAGVAPVEDDDGNAASGRREREPEPNRPVPSQPASVDPWEVFETGCRAAKFSLEQVDEWLLKQGKKRIGDLDGAKFAEFTAWLFGASAKAAEARAQIGAK